MAKKKNNHTSAQKDTEPVQAKKADASAPVNDALGEFAGITMPQKDESAQGDKKSQKDEPADEVVLAIDEDRTRLLLQGVLYLLLAFFGLFLVAGGVGATQISQNVAYMLLVLVGLPVAWFASKAMGRRLGKYLKHVGVMDFGKRGVTLYEGTDEKKALSVSYKDIKNYKMVRQGRAIRLLLVGDWVRHPSGYYLVDINRPFMADTLDGLEQDIKRLMREHRVNVHK